MDIGSMLRVLRKLAVDNSPMILTGLAVAGVFTTTVLAVRSTPYALRDLEYGAEEKKEPLTKRDVVALTWKNYIPAVAMGGATIACIIGANSISTKRNAALVSVYSLTETAFKEYRGKVIETLGESKDQKVRDLVAKDRLDKNPVTEGQVIVTGTGEQLCYDSLSGRYFKGDMETIRRSQNDINSQVLSDGYASQNEFYSLIGLPTASFGEEVGWTTDNMLEILFSAHISEDGRPCLSLDYRVAPVRGFYKIH